MSTKKNSKFHIILTPAPRKIINKKSRKPQSKLFFLDDNANHIPEIDEHCPNDDDDHIVISSPEVSAVEASTSHSDSSIIIISDDSGCISQDTSLKLDETPKFQRRMLATHRTEVNKDFWNIDDSDEKAFIAIYMKKSPLSFTSELPQFVNFECDDELSRESATVSVRVEKGFSVKSGGLLSGYGKVKKRRTVAQRKNEWRKHSTRFSL